MAEAVRWASGAAAGALYARCVSTTVLATKLFAPAGRSRLVTRSRLAEQLDGTLGDDHRLSLVSAPAGFGKTTLLADWIARLPQQRPGVSAGWLSLDAGDNDLPRLLTHLVAALAGCGLDIDTAVLEANPAAAGSDTLTALLNEVERAGRQTPERHWILVLDDYHVIDAPAVHEALAYVLDHLPHQLHLVVATRADPPLPLARLRSRGQLTEVRAADLRFTQSEALEFLNQVMGLDLTAGDVDALEERTEGWIAGLQLAALSLRDIPDRDAVAGFIDAFTGSNRFVIDYLVDEVLARQRPDVRAFLLQTSVLERLTGALCDEVTGGGGSGPVLEQLERDNVFVVPLDSERCWYRYHHLFADVLRARLVSEQPDVVPTLHRRASGWYAAHQLVPDAVRHALAAGDFDRAAYLVEAALPDLRRARQDSLLLGWARSLPEAVVARSPVLCILVGWSLMIAGDLEGMERQLDLAEAALAAGSDDPALAATWADTEDLRTAPATLWLYRAALAQARGDVAATARHARRALDLADAGDHFVRGGAAGFLGLAAWAAGDVQEALSTFTEAVRSLHAAGNVVDALDSTVVLGDMWITAGRPLRARRLYEQALATATERGEPYPRATPDLHVGLAELDRELDDLVSAEAHLDTARALGEHGSITENRHRRYVALAQLRVATGDHASARKLLDQAETLYRPGSYPDLRPLAAIRARVHIAEGDLVAAEEWAHEHGVTAADDASFLREYEHLTLVRLLLARHESGATAEGDVSDPDPVGEAATLLDRLHAQADPSRGGSLLEIGMLRALTHEAAGRRHEALLELERALSRAPEPDGYVRLFLDEGDPMLALLRDAASSGGAAEVEVLRRHARRLLGAARGTRSAAATGSAPGPPAARGPLPDPLSERELEVLRLLDSELTGPEIARQLFVSLNTLRTHTKRIFTKLDVNNRTAAVRRGRERGLL